MKALKHLFAGVLVLLFAPCMGQQFVNGTLYQDSVLPRQRIYTTGHVSQAYYDAIQYDTAWDFRVYLDTIWSPYWYWDNFRANIKGFDTLDAEGQGVRCSVQAKRIGYAHNREDMLLLASLNTDTMMNFGWSLELSDTLAHHTTYSVSNAMNVSHDYLHRFNSNTNTYFDTLDLFKPLTTSWYLRIGLSNSPTQEGDSVGRIDKNSYAYTGNTYFYDSIELVENWDIEKKWYVHRYFQETFNTGTLSGKYITFRFRSEPRIGTEPRMIRFSRNVFTGNKYGQYKGSTAYLDNFGLGCFTHIQDTLCIGVDTVELRTDNPLHKHLWSTGDTSKVIYVTEPGTYWVRTDNHGCIGRDTITIVDWGCDTATSFVEQEYYVPSAFTPNGDGLNDFFGKSDKNWEVTKIEIYNRWGQKIYSSNRSWDGNLGSQPAQPGVYLYRLVLESNRGVRTKNINGVLHLLR